LASLEDFGRVDNSAESIYRTIKVSWLISRQR